jgi:hypothetical protein
MKLQGIILPASAAVSTPIIVPVGALGGTVKLLIVIVINLSGGAISLLNKCPAPFPEGRKRPLFSLLRVFSNCVYHNIVNVNMA